MNPNLQLLKKTKLYLLRMILVGALVLALVIAERGQTLQAAAKGQDFIIQPRQAASSLSEVDEFPGKNISSLPFTDTVDTTGATSNTGGITDPSSILLEDCNSNQGEASVWYRYTPSVDINLYIDTSGSNYDTLLAVWAGNSGEVDPGNLTLVACNDDISNIPPIEIQSKVVFSAQVGTTYYIEVIDYAGPAPTAQAGPGGILNFYVEGSPAAFGKTAPSNAATGQSLSPTLSWESSARATSYEYCYSSAPGPCSAWRPAGSNTFVNLSGLTANYTYYWQVRAVNAAGATEADGGAWWSFTTQSTPACSWPAYTAPATPTFGDVPMNVNHWDWVERLYNSGITAGCGNGNYCPLNDVVRAQMAIFLLRAKHCGNGYTPPAVGGSTGFNDVPLSATYAPWVKQLAAEGITAGCGGGNFCPLQAVNRAQMAIFLLRAKHGATYSPPGTGAITGFNDVPLSATYAPWVKQLAAEGITAGCGGGNFCPLQNVNRAQMATFLVRAFGLP